MIFSLVLAFAFALVAVIFALGNKDPITVSFLTWSLEEQPLALVLLAAVALGILIGILLMSPSAIKRNLALAGQKRKLKGSEKELNKQKTKLTKIEEKEKAKEEERKEEELANTLAEAQETVDEATKQV